MAILWDLDGKDEVIVGRGAWHEGGVALKYIVEPTGIDGDWEAKFEGVILGHGQLKRVLEICERNEPSQPTIARRRNAAT